ncbi:hypothetical protein BU23DRAFT_577669 [Bimuria novae-zelandiae CBS 107.79]|uniref:Uncharacterized protein n=1 Tax=Bimuria novae-zelandiae CBS 107.79 TaxID=1447943 RepID=A0A6A5VNY6_9PLEO|nr:hypothetical protein BU23DRAFT_577669 [Bimuria novae-zelandiae CBS 107.79]
MVNGPITFRGRLPGLRNKRKANVYITKKKEANLKLAIKLRNNRISNLKVHGRIYIFKSRLVREVKGKTTKPYKKSRLYTKQRARGAYIQPSNKDIKVLNKRLKWQMENLNRGLRYIPITLINAKLMVFVDGSFTNNKDLSSQLGFILMLINKSTDSNNTFTIYGNIIHYSLTKCKRVTQSVLAFKIYGMIITERLGLPAVPLVIYTDSYSLYKCLVKLGTTKKKRLIINIMALRQLYERREIIEI